MYYYYPPFYTPKTIQNPQKNNVYNRNSMPQNYSNYYKAHALEKNSINTTKNKKRNDTAFSDNTVLFEIFGIKLYFDDLLIICLIFFLYSEGVQDQILFIALILLLLS